MSKTRLIHFSLLFCSQPELRTTKFLPIRIVNFKFRNTTSTAKRSTLSRCPFHGEEGRNTTNTVVEPSRLTARSVRHLPIDDTTVPCPRKCFEQLIAKMLSRRIRRSARSPPLLLYLWCRATPLNPLRGSNTMSLITNPIVTSTTASTASSERVSMVTSTMSRLFSML